MTLNRKTKNELGMWGVVLFFIFFSLIGMAYGYNAKIYKHPPGRLQGPPPPVHQNYQRQNDSHVSPVNQSGGTSVIVDTGQVYCYDENGRIDPPQRIEAFYGQDAQFVGSQPQYKDNGDGTITDLNTGLMWQKDPGKKRSWQQAMAGQSSVNLAGYDDWRLPTIKELYSLIDFSGQTGMSADQSIPYIDVNFFMFKYGDEARQERFIDCQFISATQYAGTTMNGDQTVFGVNFADGRIKGYPFIDPRTGEEKPFYVRYVRGGDPYGENLLQDNGDGTISDLNTGLMWMKLDSGAFEAGPDGDGSMNWKQALKFAQELDFGGYSDWRLPNAKELQHLVDYTRSLKATQSAAIDPLFESTPILDEAGDQNYGFYWTSTTHLDGNIPGASAVYISFGEALGWMKSPVTGQYVLMDVHGAGAQRSDPKTGNPDDYPFGMGPQGDVRRIYNMVRCVRDI